MIAQRERTLELANAFLKEVRRDLERAAADGSDLPPRIRTMHTRVGHATPEYRSLAIPIPGGASPEVLSSVIAHYARAKPPCCIVLALDALADDEAGEPRSVLIAEARDRWGTRGFLMQPFRLLEGRIAWGEPLTGGWSDPGEQEMILDAAFQAEVPAGSDAGPQLVPARGSD